MTGRATSAPTASGLPGWTAIRQKSRLPSRSITPRTWSWRPTLTPPEVTQQVAPPLASRRARDSSIGGSARPARARQDQRLAAGLGDGRGQREARWRRGSGRGRAARPAATQLVAGRQDRDHAGGGAPSTSAMPMAPGARSSTGVSGAAAARSRRRRGRRVPAARTWAPALRAATVTTPSRSSDACSIGTTVSAPPGIGAPVMIRTAVPGSHRWSRRPAGARLADHAQRDLGVSAARTAKPSMAEFANGGTSMPRAISSDRPARVRAASDRATDARIGQSRMPASRRASASSSESIGR